ncbi:MAG: GNAT family N-acetyltransferase [Woeseiaceae bacterium]|nr:GNAT family N-acetyltransferase [Woeseiaceae bacterium]
MRSATRDDLDALVRGNQLMAEETEGRRLDAALLRAGAGRVLDDPARGRYWVAEDGGQVVGQLMVTREWSDWRNGHFWWIQSVYVDENYRRAGVFRALYRHVHALALEASDCCGLRLYVENYNRRARRAYERLGMVDAGYLVMETDFRQSSAECPGKGA